MFPPQKMKKHGLENSVHNQWVQFEPQKWLIFNSTIIFYPAVHITHQSKSIRDSWMKDDMVNFQLWIELGVEFSQVSTNNLAHCKIYVTNMKFREKKTNLWTGEAIKWRNVVIEDEDALSDWKPNGLSLMSEPGTNDAK